MKNHSNNQQAFLALLRAGLWEKDACLLPYGNIDFQEIYRLAQEQSVVGIIAAGLEHIIDIKVPKKDVLTFVGSTLQLEQRNNAMNCFIAELMERLNRGGVYPLLVKGQGIAQCYERPLWRTCGDVDLLLDDNNYEKAIQLLCDYYQNDWEEDPLDKHWEMIVDPWEIELHGRLNTHLSKRIDKGIWNIQYNAFIDNRFRLWHNNGVGIALPQIDDDIIFIFTHILKHFFHGGIGLRQICDWCRLLYIYKTEINVQLLETRLRKMSIMTEWKAFAALAVDTLGMSVEAMPFYDTRFTVKGERIFALILELGSFGHNRDNSYYQEYPYIVYKAMSLCRNTWDAMRHFMIFPLDATRVWWNRLCVGIMTVAKGK